MKGVRLGIAVLSAIAAAAFAAAPALAEHGPAHPSFDPQTTNVPYLAWRGEEVRLVKCDPTLAAGVRQGTLAADWIVEDWSGEAFQRPSLEASTVRFFAGSGERAGEGCVKANFVSVKAGLAMIKLVVSAEALGSPVLNH